ncbi:ABC transporter permease [Haloplasma contractile]|uniref:Oligopeptide ABC transporter permease component protein n=1 Tax=Haloplasma contractile SSD-17B TaxID=1033810 RepID=U2FFF1_9MOLU|nr:ABC transporter permease [Haloplasma contractile]ERJ11650.1 Oligopeptide ABC transporter permease component protein [Haloplasma contractile SSD-17B]
MGSYYLKRFLYSILTLFIIITIVFFMLRTVPGGPFSKEKPLPPKTEAKLEAQYGLDDPVYIQYFKYLGNLVRGDLGVSLKDPAYSVNQLLADGIQYTAKIGLLAAVVITVIGIPLGIISALRANTAVDYGSMFLATLGITIPSFVIGSLFILMAQYVEWIPVGGLDEPIAYVGPVIALSGYSLAFITRLTRSSMLEVVGQDYIRTARANGLSKRKVVFKHALKNSLIPVVTYTGPMIAALLTGSFVVEKIFVINGIGRFFTDSVSNRDYTLTMGVTIFYASFYIFMVLLVDIIYSLIDPRIKVSK